MEKYLALIVLAAPGFVANYVATTLGVTSSKKSEFETLGCYFAYSFFSVIVTLLLASLFNLINLDNTWQDVTNNMSSVYMALKFFLLALFSGLITGIGWAVLLNDIFITFLNKINIARGRNIRNLNGSLLNRIFADGKEHFIIIRKDGVDVAVGFIFAASDPFDSHKEIVITEYPEYRIELKKAQNSDSDSPLRNILQTYIDIENNLIITETEYPAEWLSTYSAA